MSQSRLGSGSRAGVRPRNVDSALEKELGQPQDITEVQKKILAHFKQLFDFTIVK